MRILLDDCVPVDLAPHIRGHEVASVRDRGWQRLKDRNLLDTMAGDFQVLLTVDASIPYQQMIAGREVSVVILRARSNRVAHLARLIPELIEILRTIEPGTVREIS